MSEPVRPPGTHIWTRTSRRAALATGVVALAVAGVLLAVAAAAGDGHRRAAAFTTAKAAVRDLTRTETLSGVVAYRDLRDLPSARSGVITWLPAVGGDLTSGQVVMRIDDRPVVLLAGSVPAWRDLHAGVGDGPDVKELETALRTLGYGKPSAGFPDGHWNWETTEALKAFQAKVGAVVDGSLSLGEAVFTPGDIHIAKLSAPLGGLTAPGQPAMSVQSTERVVILDLNPLDKDLVVKGAAVQVELPTGDRVAGAVESVSTTLELNAQNKQVFKVRVALKDKATVNSLALAPVIVHYTTTVARDVLSVPVTAIVGVPGGGYAVDVVDAADGTGDTGVQGESDGHTTRTTVTLGAWGDGFVQVTGKLAAGSTVEVPG